MASQNDMTYREHEKFSDDKGAKRGIDAGLKTKIYTAGAYTYVCEADSGTGLSSSVWRITRIDSSGNTDNPDGDNGFKFVAEDYADYSYS